MVSKNIQEKKQMKKYFSFIIYNYCFFSINLFERLIDLADINFNTIHYLLINFITNIYILCLTNNISLDKIKPILDEGALIIFDYLTISREESLDTSTYKIKYNDAIHFAYQKILTKINIIVREQGSILNNLKSMNTNKNLSLVIEGINTIKNIFNCIFKIQFIHNLTILKYIDVTYYQSTISELKSNAMSHLTTDVILCKKIDKIHKQLNDILFYNIDILENFIITLIPDILSCIKSSDFNNNIYCIYFGYLTEYYCKLDKNKTGDNL
jgi:virulence-associated protein VapD